MAGKRANGTGVFVWCHTYAIASHVICMLKDGRGAREKRHHHSTSLFINNECCLWLQRSINIPHQTAWRDQQPIINGKQNCDNQYHLDSGFNVQKYAVVRTSFHIPGQPTEPSQRPCSIPSKITCPHT